MKILLSPSKTKTLCGTPHRSSFHLAMTEQIVRQMQTLSIERIANALAIATDKASKVHDFFLHYENMPIGAAAASYSGLSFKRLNWATLDAKAQAFGEEHLVILSALYGVLEPSMPIKDYRLDLVNPILKEEKTSLYNWWRPLVADYFSGEDWILNLASKEYARLVEHPLMVTVEFQELKKEVWKQLSTSSKMMRGLLARYMLEHRVTDIQQLPQQIGDFTLHSALPTSVTEPMTIVYRNDRNR